MAEEDTGTPRERALEWWREHAEREEYVVGKSRFPGPAESRFLRSGGYVLEVAAGGVWILARPGIDALPDALYPNYWKVVRLVMDAYTPAVVERISAVRLHTGNVTPPSALMVRQAANSSKRTIEIATGYEVMVRPGEVEPEHVIHYRLPGAEVPAEDPVSTLLGLPVDLLRDDPESIAIWLKSLVVARPQIEAAYVKRPRPVVLKRLGEIAREVGNSRLAEQIDAVLTGEYAHRIGRGHTGRGPRFTVPAHVADLRTTHQPWLDRQAVTFARFRTAVERELRAAEGMLPRAGLDALLGQAREAKAYDAYHSTTIEGYRVSRDEVSAVIRGATVGGHDPEEVRGRMAVAGYARAFDRVMSVLRDTAGPVEINEAVIQDLYLDLFGPSVDAGIVSPDALRGWRTEPAYLRGHLHVPPGADKVPRLMQQYQRLVNGIGGHPVVRAVMAHLEFVTVHPYPDGNGRLARFLMNVALVGEGLPWVTIRNDDRERYFTALATAQVDGDPLPFARLVFGYVLRAVDLGPGH